MDQDYNFEEKRIEVEKIYTSLVTKSSTLEKRLLEINDHFKNAKQNEKEFAVQRNELNKIFTSATNSINKFRTDKQNIGKLLKASQNFYDNKFIPLRNFVNDPDIGISGTLKFSKAQKKEIEKVVATCEAQYKKISENVKVHGSTLKSLIELEKGINRIFNEVTIKGTISQTLLEEISFANKHAQALESKIEINSKKSADLKTEIENLQKKAENTLAAINDFRDKSEETYKDILSIYEIAADTGRSGEFDRRRKALSFELIKWERNLHFITAFLLIFIICFFFLQLYFYDWKIKDAGNDINFYLRFLLASPVIFYISFASVQYTKVRKLIDQYTFKTTLAVSIKSHLELLRNDKQFDQPQHINDILKFTIESLQNIYKEPYNDDKMRLHLKIKEIDLKLEKDNQIRSKVDVLEEKINLLLSNG